MLTPEQVRDIAERTAERTVEAVAERAAEKAATKAVTEILTSLGVDINNMAKEQRVWAFARTMQQGTSRGIMALTTGFLSMVATLIAGAIWYFFFNKPHP
jgi:hypothetical protein